MFRHVVCNVLLATFLFSPWHTPPLIQKIKTENNLDEPKKTSHTYSWQFGSLELKSIPKLSHPRWEFLQRIVYPKRQCVARARIPVKREYLRRNYCILLGRSTIHAQRILHRGLPMAGPGGDFIKSDSFWRNIDWISANDVSTKIQNMFYLQESKI